MSWAYLIAAGVFEIVGFIGLKRAAMKDSWLNYGLMMGAFVMSVLLLSQAIETLPLSLAYAVWAGIGTLGAGILGIVLYKEPVNFMRITAMIGIVLTVIALRLTS
ncbi:DMT family transporter [Bacillus horti]|uniref:Paired small multidrug resistance pump n=1 Tax=Caldalkalibacillus horti TaxID=77523 RepID=A0ABT9VVB4_9BACI|nr:multidrug efflux SMR transporter [Bacillus horti]MDQ0164934.1 paired small multidrug resistance pump [Bacillus horti]